jgi:hypothetical protein
MNTNRLGNFLALGAAAFLGGIVSHFVTPQSALAQDQVPVTSEIRTQSLTLVDPANRPIGTFTSEIHASPNGFNGSRPSATRIVLLDPAGRILWRADSGFALINQPVTSIQSPTR